MGAAAMTAGASLRKPVAWRQINWRRAHRNVRRLQIRIVKAGQQSVAKPRPVRGALSKA